MKKNNGVKFKVLGVQLNSVRYGIHVSNIQSAAELIIRIEIGAKCISR
jgi:hypothetical protein